MNGLVSGTTTGALREVEAGAVVILLFAFGVVYNRYVAKLHRERPTFPDSVLVVAGVIVTMIAGQALQCLTGWPFLMVASVCFTADGFPMIYGELLRITDNSRAVADAQARLVERLHIDAQRKAREQGEEDCQDGDGSEAGSAKVGEETA